MTRMLIPLVLAVITQPTHGDELVKDLAAAAEARVQFALTRPGNVERGEAIFNNSSKVACSVCHLVYGREIRKGGPNLFGVGDKFTRESLILAIERPSESILPGFETTVIETKDGEEHTGILRTVLQDGYTLADALGGTRTISHEDFAARRTLQTSLMPEGLTAGLSNQEYADLIEFLLAQKTTGLVGLQGPDQGATIGILEEAVKLTPFHTTEISFRGAVEMRPLPGIERQFVLLEHDSGRIWRLDKSREGGSKHLFLDLQSLQWAQELSADGLVGIAFHPDFVDNNKYYLKYNATEDRQLLTILEERTARADRLADSGQPPRRLLQVSQPASNHNGGCLQFGPEGYLYTAFGDGGPQRDPNGYSQSLRHLLGAMIRIDVNGRSGQQAYRIPKDNPFATPSTSQSEIRREIWAYGFREPWRFSFDLVTGDLWLGDVGQNEYEEVAIVRKGENHGWNVYEAYDEFSDEYRGLNQVYAPPVFAYSHKLGTSITGGYVYRGDKAAPLYGYYICGDHESRRLFAIKADPAGQLEQVFEIGHAPQRVSSFCLDDRGELLLVGYQGTVYRLELASVRLKTRELK